MITKRNLFQVCLLGAMLLVLPTAVQAQLIINTVAGGVGDGGQATNATLALGDPSGLTVDASGNLFIADSYNNSIRKVNVNGVITTVAGSGSYNLSGADASGGSYAGDGGAATNASLNSPQCVAVDAAGNLFIADSLNNCIRKVSTNGIITTVAGIGYAVTNDNQFPIYRYSGDGGAATNAELGYPCGVAVDAAGNLFIADSFNNVIRKVNVNGVITTVAGNGFGYGPPYNSGYYGDGGAATNALLSDPTSVAVDAAGNLFIADNGRIRKVGTNGIITTVAGGGSINPTNGGAATNADIAAISVAVDAAGNLFIAAAGSDTGSFIYKVSTNGIIATVAGNGYVNPIGPPWGGYSGDGGEATNAALDLPSGVAVDALGNLFIADTDNYRIRKVNINGVITTVAGNGKTTYEAAVFGGGNFYPGCFSGDGGLATSASLNIPQGVAVDAFGNLFIADTGNYRIRKVNVNGVITTVAGNGTNGYSGDGGLATSASLNIPQGVAVDAFGNLFIADTDNYRIRKVDVNGVITTVAGNGYPGYSGDGGAATSASLNIPQGVAVDAFGNLFIDSGVKIRKVDVNGVITTVAGNGTNGFSGDGGAATNASLSEPLGIFTGGSGVAVDASGDLLIADSGNNRIRKVGTNGIITTVAGNGSANPNGGAGLYTGYVGDGGQATNAFLNTPTGVAVDATGNLFIADLYNNRVRKVSTNGIITTVAGNANYGFSGDGGAATNASLWIPVGVAVSASGNLFIADSDNSRVREVADASVPAPTGSLQVTTLALPNGTNGLAYSQQLSAIYGQLPYSWSLIFGSLPSGLTLATNGLISGTPTNNGTFNFTVKVTDILSETATQTLELDGRHCPQCCDATDE